MRPAILARNLHPNTEPTDRNRSQRWDFASRRGTRRFVSHLLRREPRTQGSARKRSVGDIGGRKMTPTSTVRAYHLLSSHHALDNLRHRRLKIAQLDDLNDPFDLWTLAQPDRKLRMALRLFRREVAQTFGMVCFSMAWHNPLLWSHYGDRHRGIALGFDLDATK